MTLYRPTESGTIKGANKILTFDALTERDEPRVILLDNTNRRGLYKHASAGALDYCSAFSPRDGFRHVLVLAMSAGEYYGPNRNGDAFSERPVQGKDGQWLVAPGETLLDHYRTFEQHAHVYKHHINKDPERGYGNVEKAFYNHTMHRVELLLNIDLSKAAGQFFMQAIERGEYPGVSMGCRIKYDVCSLCGNHAATRADYCHHVNNLDPRFGMNRLLESGERCFVWNPSPVLFDISFVLKPADRIGYMMKKVASPYALQSSNTSSRELGEYSEHLEEKSAALRKISAIDKVIHGQAVPLDETPLSPAEQRGVQYMISNVIRPDGYRDMPDVLIREVAVRPLPVVASSMFAAGVVPTARDLMKIMLAQWGLAAPPSLLDVVGTSQGAIAELLAEHPEVLDAQMFKSASTVSAAYVDPSLRDKIAESMNDRSLWVDHVMRSNIPESYGTALSVLQNPGQTSAYHVGTLEPLYYTDPETGRQYVTTREAAERADWSNKKKLMAESAGAAGLLGLSYKALSGRAGGVKGALIGAPALATAGVLGKQTYDAQKVPKVTTAKGQRIPVNTELSEKVSSLAGALKRDAPAVGGAGALTLLAAQDVYGRPDIAQKVNENKATTFIGLSIPVAALAYGGRRGLQHLLANRGRLRDAFKRMTTRGVKEASLYNFYEDEYTVPDPHADYGAFAEKVANVVGHALLELAGYPDPR